MEPEEKTIQLHATPEQAAAIKRLVELCPLPRYTFPIAPNREVEIIFRGGLPASSEQWAGLRLWIDGIMQAQQRERDPEPEDKS